MNQNLAKRLISLLLTLSLFSNPVFATLSEANFWKARRELLENKKFESNKKPLQYAQLGGSLTSPLNFSLSSPLLSKSIKTTNMPDCIKKAFIFTPLKIGQIRSVLLPPSGAIKGVVVYLQDIHLNIEAQKQIADFISEISTKGLPVKFIGLEGAFSEKEGQEPLEFSKFNQYPLQDIVKSSVQSLLLSKKIGGPVASKLTNSLSLELVGIDDGESYKKNVLAYLSSRKNLTKLKSRIIEERHHLDDLKLLTFNTKLADFDRVVCDYQSQKIPFGEYLKVLSSYHHVQSPQISFYLKGLNYEKKINFSQVEVERNNFISKLTQSLSSVDLENLFQLSLQYRSAQINHLSFYQELQALAKKSKTDLNQFPEFNQYLQYVFICDKIDSEKLFNDSLSLEKSIYSSLILNPQEKALLAQSRNNFLTTKLVDFSFSHEEWNEYKSELRSTTLNHEVELLREPFIEFYSQAEKRDKFMAQNYLSTIGKNKDEFSLLLTGGFHSKGISDSLIKNGYAVIQWTPRISKIDAEGGSTYLSVFTQEKNSLERIFQGEKLFLSPPVWTAYLKNYLSLVIDGNSVLGNRKAPLLTSAWADIKVDDANSIQVRIKSSNKFSQGFKLIFSGEKFGAIVDSFAIKDLMPALEPKLMEYFSLKRKLSLALAARLTVFIEEVYLGLVPLGLFSYFTLHHHIVKNLSVHFLVTALSLFSVYRHGFVKTKSQIQTRYQKPMAILGVFLVRFNLGYFWVGSLYVWHFIPETSVFFIIPPFLVLFVSSIIHHVLFDQLLIRLQKDSTGHNPLFTKTTKLTEAATSLYEAEQNPELDAFDHNEWRDYYFIRRQMLASLLKLRRTNTEEFNRGTADIARNIGFRIWGPNYMKVRPHNIGLKMEIYSKLLSSLLGIVIDVKLQQKFPELKDDVVFTLAGSGGRGELLPFSDLEIFAINVKRNSDKQHQDEIKKLIAELNDDLKAIFISNPPKQINYWDIEYVQSVFKDAEKFFNQQKPFEVENLNSGQLKEFRVFGEIITKILDNNVISDLDTDSHSTKNIAWSKFTESLKSLIEEKRSFLVLFTTSMINNRIAPHGFSGAIHLKEINLKTSFGASRTYQILYWLRLLLGDKAISDSQWKKANDSFQQVQLYRVELAKVKNKILAKQIADVVQNTFKDEKENAGESFELELRTLLSGFYEDKWKSITSPEHPFSKFKNPEKIDEIFKKILRTFPTGELSFDPENQIEVGRSLSKIYGPQWMEGLKPFNPNAEAFKDPSRIFQFGLMKDYFHHARVIATLTKNAAWKSIRSLNRKSPPFLKKLKETFFWSIQKLRRRVDPTQINFKRISADPSLSHLVPLLKYFKIGENPIGFTFDELTGFRYAGADNLELRFSNARTNIFDKDPSLILDVFDLSLKLKVRLGPDVMMKIETTMPEFLNKVVPPSVNDNQIVPPNEMYIKAIRSFNRIMSDPSDIRGIWWIMFRLGIFSHLFPEFRRVENIIPNDHLHTWTIDNHLAKAFEKLELARYQEAGSPLKTLFEWAVEHKKIYEIRMAIIFHDIGKPTWRNMDGVDHDKFGANELMPGILKRLLVSENSENLIRWLILNDTLLGERTRRIVFRDNEPGKINGIAATNLIEKVFDHSSKGLPLEKVVKNKEQKEWLESTLRLILLLTYADASAVNPQMEKGILSELPKLKVLVDFLIDPNADITKKILEIRKSAEKKIKPEILKIVSEEKRTISNREALRLISGYFKLVSVPIWIGRDPKAVAEEILALYSTNEVEVLVRGPFAKTNILRSIEAPYDVSVIVKEDKPGVLSKILAVFLANNFNVEGSIVNSNSLKTNGNGPYKDVVFDRFFLKYNGPAKTDVELQTKMQFQLEEVLKGRKKVSDLFPPHQYLVNLAPFTAVFSNDLDGESVLELTGKDSPGTLHLLTRILYEIHGVNILHASIQTREKMGDTLFLNSISELKKKSILKDLRILSEYVVQNRVGHEETYPINPDQIIEYLRQQSELTMTTPQNSPQPPPFLMIFIFAVLNFFSIQSYGNELTQKEPSVIPLVTQTKFVEKMAEVTPVSRNVNALLANTRLNIDLENADGKLNNSLRTPISDLLNHTFIEDHKAVIIYVNNVTSSRIETLLHEVKMHQGKTVILISENNQIYQKLANSKLDSTGLNIRLISPESSPLLSENEISWRNLTGLLSQQIEQRELAQFTGMQVILPDHMSVQFDGTVGNDWIFRQVVFTFINQELMGLNVLIPSVETAISISKNVSIYS